MPKKESRTRPSTGKRDRRSNEVPLEPEPIHQDLLQSNRVAYMNLMPQNVNAFLSHMEEPSDAVNQRDAPEPSSSFDLHDPIAELFDCDMDNERRSSEPAQGRTAANAPIQRSGTVTNSNVRNSVNQPSKSPSSRSPSSNSLHDLLSTHSNSTSNSKSAISRGRSPVPRDLYTMASRLLDFDPTNSVMSGGLDLSSMDGSPSIEMFTNSLTSLWHSENRNAQNSQSNTNQPEHSAMANCNRFLPSIVSDEQNSESPKNTEEAEPNNGKDDAMPVVGQKLYSSSFVGIGVKSIQCIWEQCNTFPVAFPLRSKEIMAEDTSYKLWELVDSLRSYTIHSGGVLTKSLVNQVIKDFNVPPIVYAETNRTEWMKIKDSGRNGKPTLRAFYFKPKKEISVQEECNTHEFVKDYGSLGLEAEWRSSVRAKRITLYMRSLLNCSMLGNDQSYSIAVRHFRTNPFIGSMLPALLTQLVDSLSFDTHKIRLKPSLGVLEALSYSFFTRDVTIELKQFHLANVFVCMLFDVLDKKRPDVMAISPPDNPHAHPPNAKRKDSEATVKTPRQPTEEQLIDAGLEPMVKWQQQPNHDEPTTQFEIDLSRLEDSRKSLLRRVRIISQAWIDGADDDVGDDNDKDDNEKEETVDDPAKQKRITKCSFSNDPLVADCDKCIDAGNESSPSRQGRAAIVATGQPPDDDPGSDDSGDRNATNNDDMDIDKGPSDISPESVESSSKCEWDTEPGRPGDHPNLTVPTDEFESAFETSAVDDSFVEQLNTVIGCLGSKWGHVEHELIHLLNVRMQYFFKHRNRSNYTKKDIDWLLRMLQVSVNLGDFAFRELSIYFNRFPADVPESFKSYMKVGAQYVGRHDWFMYEYLQHVVGDALIPFLIEYPRYLEKVGKRFHKWKRSPRLPKEEYTILCRQSFEEAYYNAVAMHRKSLANNRARRSDSIRWNSVDDIDDNENNSTSQTVPISQINSDEEDAWMIKKPPVNLDVLFPDRVPLLPRTTPDVRFQFGSIDHVYRRPRPTNVTINGKPTGFSVFFTNRRLTLRKLPKQYPKCFALYDQKLYYL